MVNALPCRSIGSTVNGPSPRIVTVSPSRAAATAASRHEKRFSGMLVRQTQWEGASAAQARGGRAVALNGWRAGAAMPKPSTIATGHQYSDRPPLFRFAAFV